jgi:hypothetical protein
VTRQYELDLDPQTPRLWEDRGDDGVVRLMCAWCGARSPEEWHEMQLEGAHCPCCHYRPPKDAPAQESSPA